MFIDNEVNAVLDTISEGIVFIDSAGVIKYANIAYKKFLFKEKLTAKTDESIEGQMLDKFQPESRLFDALKNGKTILHGIRKEHKNIYFANIYPVKKRGLVTGAIAVITFSEQAADFRTELENYEKYTKQVIRSANKANTARYTFDSIIAASAVSREVKSLAKKIAKTDSTVLLQSESGTGKELFAQAIHNASRRANEIFVAINCANFNADLLDAELFGYEQGAFTGALKDGKMGLFEAAHHGTLFLDEVSEMPMPLQAKLLRVLQERRFRRVGAVREIDVDVRIVAACNANLGQYIKEGKFRKDLYFRLNVFSLRIPPLRDRLGELDTFTERLLGEFSQKLKRPLSITTDAMRLLKRYNWPGNVRELRNVLECAGYLSETGVIGVNELPSHISRNSESPRTDTAQPLSPAGFQIPGSEKVPSPSTVKSLSEKVKLFEKAEILRAIAQNGGGLTGKKKAAGELRISLSSLYSKIS
jgi:transcriptional regulator with PAS, ATPase and Fis domain